MEPFFNAFCLTLKQCSTVDSLVSQVITLWKFDRSWPGSIYLSSSPKSPIKLWA